MRQVCCLLTTIIICVCVLRSVYDNTYIYKGDISIGETYLVSFDWDNEDPFREARIDTLRVLDMDRGFVKIEYFNGHMSSIKSSVSEKVFRRIIKPIKK